jgi:hypothetical protein
MTQIVIRSIFVTQENQNIFQILLKILYSRWLDAKTGEEIAKSLSSLIENKFLSLMG